MDAKNATLTPAIELLETARESGIAPSQLKKLIELARQKNLSKEQVSSVLRSPCFPDLLEAAKRGSLAAVDRAIFRHVLGLSPTVDGKEAPYPINCDTAPYIPDGWSVEAHHKDGQFVWNPNAVELYLADEQKEGRIIGTELRKKLQDKPVLNANVLDYLLKPKNQHLIPEEWKGKAVFFWGTVYRYSDGNLCVRYLYWSVGGWFWSLYWLEHDWNAHDPAALRAS
ncbi:MAG: hypothetical protein HYY92_00090 [Parcubacteria group bacterium]|nr:hypothetical protein [Parcubacteria group bacterium]